jgi:hypothetical protein
VPPPTSPRRLPSWQIEDSPEDLQPERRLEARINGEREATARTRASLRPCCSISSPKRRARLLQELRTSTPANVDAIRPDRAADETR